MARSTVRRSLLLISFLLAFLAPVATFAQTPNVSGTVVDESGAVLAGARVTLLDAKGTVVRTVVTDAAGAFNTALAPGTYTARIEASRFVPVSQPITVSGNGATPVLSVVLKAGGFSENVVVTASRAETRATETPQTMEIVDATDVRRTVAVDATDLLKKNASVDVIQYSGTLSGIGVRGFRPQFSGINKRSLLLIDGRPSGVTNLATLLLDNVARVEVLKGAASAVYGSSAMGGVVNVITRQSTGPIGGELRLGGGSFGTSDIAGRLGGRAGSRLDFDVSGRALDQRGDIRMGDGVVRESTSYETYSGSGRVGVDAGNGWRVEGRTEIYRGLDLESPPDLASGNVGQSSKDVERGSGDARLTGLFRGHELLVAGFWAGEASHTSNVTTFNPADEPYLPYLSFESDLGWSGAQIRDVFNWNAANRLVLGVDYERVTSTSRSYSRTGEAVAPFSADSNKHTVGVYFENTLRLFENRTILVAGGRVDRITTATLETRSRPTSSPRKRRSTSSARASASSRRSRGTCAGTSPSAGRSFRPTRCSSPATPRR
jgi:outer membrane receptor protein involved in Fe transport